MPYFKFYSSEWNDGDITLEDYETQGVFISVCSYYWSRECNITQSKLFKRFKDATVQLGVLMESEIIKVDKKDNIIIAFLNQQWNTREAKKATMKANGLKGGRPKKNQKLSDEKTKSFPEKNQTITNIEKKREEKKREEKNIYIPEYIDYELWKDFLDVRLKKKAVNSDRALKSLLNKLSEIEKKKPGQANAEINRSLVNSWKDIYPQEEKENKEFNTSAENWNPYK